MADSINAQLKERVIDQPAIMRLLPNMRLYVSSGQDNPIADFLRTNNAIKYGADGKRIRVRIHAEEETVTVRVINYGRVIPAAELPLIFEKFYRTEKSRSSSTGGTGLGLAIARNIAEMHGGTISVTSDLSGTAFIVTLPVHPDLDREKFADVE